MSHKDLVSNPAAITLGPAKKYSGVIEKAGIDFLTVDEATMGLIIIPLEHIKQLRIGQVDTEVGRSTTRPQPQDTGEQCFDDVLNALKNQVVQLEGGGPEATIGYLLDVREDYVITVVIPDGIVCFPKLHVHVILPLDVTIRPEFLTWLDTQRALIPTAGKLAELMHANVGKLITLGRGDPDGVSGILRAVHEGFIEIVVSPHESLWVPIHHVKSFCLQNHYDWEAAVEEFNSSSAQP